MYTSGHVYCRGTSIRKGFGIGRKYIPLLFYLFPIGTNVNNEKSAIISNMELLILEISTEF